MNLDSLDSGELNEIAEQFPGIDARRNLSEVFENMVDEDDEILDNSFDDHTLSEHIECLDYPDLGLHQDAGVDIMNETSYEMIFGDLNPFDNVYPIPLYADDFCEDLEEKRQFYLSLLFERGHDYIVLQSSTTGDYAIAKCNTENSESLLSAIAPHGKLLSQMALDDVLSIGDNLRLLLVVIVKAEAALPVWQPNSLITPMEMRTITIHSRKPIRVYDSVNLEEHSLNRFLRDNPEHLVFLIVDDDEPASIAYSLMVDQLLDMVRNQDYYFYCNEAARGTFPRLDEIEKHTALLRFSLGGQVYVYAGQVLEMLDNISENNRVFAVRKALTVPFTTSAESVRLFDQNYLNFRGQDIQALGADHCQADSEKSVYEIMKVDMTGLPPNLSNTPVFSPVASVVTPDAVRERRTRLQSIERRMQEARQAGDRQSIVQLMRERQTLQ